MPKRKPDGLEGESEPRKGCKGHGAGRVHAVFRADLRGSAAGCTRTRTSRMDFLKLPHHMFLRFNSQLMLSGLTEYLLVVLYSVNVCFRIDWILLNSNLEVNLLRI